MNQTTRFSAVSVNLPDVDQAFPQLFSDLERLQVAVLNNEDWPILNEQFTQVSLLAIKIFRREEEAMDLCRDRGAVGHKSAHQMFLRNLAGIKMKCEANGPDVALAQDLRSQVIGWLTDHHRIMNASLGRTVKDLVERSIAHHESTGAIASSRG
ncbi:MAG: hemerythrin family protein [Fibrobacterota bacterium]